MASSRFGCGAAAIWTVRVAPAALMVMVAFCIGFFGTEFQSMLTVSRASVEPEFWLRRIHGSLTVAVQLKGAVPVLKMSMKRLRSVARRKVGSVPGLDVSSVVAEPSRATPNPALVGAWPAKHLSDTIGRTWKLESALSGRDYSACSIAVGWSWSRDLRSLDRAIAVMRVLVRDIEGDRI
ncbi:hypothetical protein QEH53_22090 [Pelagicoccus sp. SDUM812002]|nr:hypothetical protein [Pelagicoccus sp. SDUM812002]MDQ8188296.1 hypothetical protein [Pelagicoccus sp. SDUM812002]